MATPLSLVPVLLRVDHTLVLHGEPVPLKAGTVYDLEPHDVEALVKQGVGDTTPANIAYHRGDLAAYEALVKAAPAAARAPRKSAAKSGASE